MSKHTQRAQKSAEVDLTDTRPVVVRPQISRDDRLHNPKDLDPDVVAQRDHVEHGGTLETRAEALTTRGSGGRKRSGPFGRYRPGRDNSKKR